VVSPEDQPLKQRRTTAAQRFADVPEVDVAPEGALNNVRMAEMLGIGPSAFSKHLKREGFPTPVGRRGRTLFHNPEEVAKWHSERFVAPHHAAAGEQSRQSSMARAQANVDEVIASGKSIDDKPSRSPRAPSSAAERAVAEIEQQDADNPNLGDQFRGLFNR
jgi:hypothetical protein